MKKYMKRFLKLSATDFTHDSRNERELEVVRSLGYEIVIIGRKTDRNGDFAVPDCTAIWKTVEPLTPVINSKAVNRLFSVIPWAIEARKQKADIISCHDIAYLFVGWLSTLGMKRKPKLIYDSHEFEYERAGERGKMLRFFVKHIERFLIKKCAFAMVVNDTIADEVKKLHKLKIRPVVVRNIPEKWEGDFSISQNLRNEFIKKNKLKDDVFICMYHGAICEGRGIEPCVKAIAQIPNAILIILGNGDVQKYKDIVSECGNESKVFFIDAVPRKVLLQYVAIANVGMVLIEPICKSYYYSLPNKLFENIQSETPVIASDFPELSRVVNSYSIGICVNPQNISEITEAIIKMKNDVSFYNKCKQNLDKAKYQLCWENERKILYNAYSQITI